MKRPPLKAETREFVQKNWLAVEKARRLSLLQNRLAQFLGWMLIALVLWGFGLMHGFEPRLVIFFIFPIPGILVIRGSAGGLRFATVALFFTALIWYMWLSPALAGTHPVTIQGHWVVAGQRGFMPLGVYPLIHVTTCLAMAIVCLVTSRVRFLTKPVIIFLLVVGLGIGIPWKIDANRRASVRRDFAAELAATKAFLIEKRYQDSVGVYPIGSNHPQSGEIARILEKNPRVRNVCTSKSRVSGAVFVYTAQKAEGGNLYCYEDWLIMPSGARLRLDFCVYLSAKP